MSDGDHRALILVVSIANVGFVYGAFFGIAFLGCLGETAIPFFWTGPISLAFGGVVCALTHVVAKKWFGKKIYQGKRSEYLAGKNAVFSLVKKSSEQKIFAMLTLSNRKVYIGLPRRVSDWKNPDPSGQHLYFLPVLSGFRDERSLKMEITTDYAEAYSNIQGIREMADLEMIVPVHEIIHAQPFDPDFYKEIQRANPASKRKSSAKSRPARKK